MALSQQAKTEITLSLDELRLIQDILHRPSSLHTKDWMEDNSGMNLEEKEKFRSHFDFIVRDFVLELEMIQYFEQMKKDNIPGEINAAMADDGEGY
tara:strand:+ start:168 stop:455 length:288 start_codon:yes stop_codon:yes gene_type:complete